MAGTQESPTSVILNAKVRGETVRYDERGISSPIAVIASIVALFVLYVFIVPGQYTLAKSIITAGMGVLIWNYTPLKTWGLVVLGVGIILVLLHLTVVVYA